jgi:hypothetical protein
LGIDLLSYQIPSKVVAVKTYRYYAAAGIGTCGTVRKPVVTLALMQAGTVGKNLLLVKFHARRQPL